ncbi:GFA family protein [Nocardia sp. CDC159]|uniref:GFA family protein n=1 Tax=Nocardia pulmonis TaxID=2951408 RepID=A0A9X2E787_9NOCA|nr:MULTISPECIES: GFA family protein [Nocardia]MCM6774468.1 GFA family protein [Nocardia pulmonis]MCM6787466.1 GFA family protein [Nocardia sp. CDC159]
MYEGGCLCGNIRFRAAGAPDFPHLCSCPHCQRLSGAPVMSWVDFPMDGFEWTGPGGEPTWFDTFPGETKRGFCPKCGSSVAAEDYGDAIVGVTMMSLDNHDGLEPERQSFRENAVPWLAPIQPRS